MADRSMVRLEVMRHALAGVAEEMGTALRRASYSPNIKERADCSAAVFGPEGAMVAQAEHIPVHLGAMPASVMAILDSLGEGMRPGVHALLNDPYRGGTHLPDITLVSAVGDDRGRVIGYVANRAHHADVGGAAPGSMPAGATDVVAEGLRIPPTIVGDRNGLRQEIIDLIVTNSRTPNERRGDLHAQFAANHVGARRLLDLTSTHGLDTLHQAMDQVCDYSERRVRGAIARIPDGRYEFSDVLEIGPRGPGSTDQLTEIRVAVTVEGDNIHIDFAGTDPQVPANLNAVRAVTVSCCYFVVRALTDPRAPPNEGCYRPIRVSTPAGSVVDARPPAPVAAGNVETSQRIVDVLFGAFAQALPDRVPAAGQGTMNNLLIGSGMEPAFSYYETLAGGEGGLPFRPGMSGIHTGMTNTLNTPAEAIELAYPLRVHRYELREGSGGAGRHPGGDGLVREVEILAPQATVTIQSERRRVPPWGLNGGASALPGRNLLVHHSGEEEELPSKGTWEVGEGDRIRIETPGGGGWGRSGEEAAED